MPVIFAAQAMSILRRAYWVLDTAREHRWRTKRLDLRADDLVLDVGSGASPHFRSNVLCDKFVWDGTERHGQSVLHDRPFVVGGVERLPFADGAFDFVICTHVLEHVEDPAAAIAELQRVARRGYIETPSAVWERLGGFPFHRWMVSVTDGQLNFARKRAPVEDPELRDWFEAFQSSLGIGAYTWFRRRAAGVYSCLSWEGRIPYEVECSRADDSAFVQAEVVENPGEQASASPPGLSDRLISGFGRRARRRSELSREAFLALLRCPACASGLELLGAEMRCRGCATSYPVDTLGRPWLLVDPLVSTG